MQVTPWILRNADTMEKIPVISFNKKHSEKNNRLIANLKSLISFRDSSSFRWFSASRKKQKVKLFHSECCKMWCDQWWMSESHDRRQICCRKLTLTTRSIRLELGSSKSCMDNGKSCGSCIMLRSSNELLSMGDHEPPLHDIVQKSHYAKTYDAWIFSKLRRRKSRPLLRWCLKSWKIL